MSDGSAFLELRTGASLSSVRVLTDLLEVALRALEVEEASRHDLALGVAELVTNVCRHEYVGEEAPSVGNYSSMRSWTRERK